MSNLHRSHGKGTPTMFTRAHLFAGKRRLIAILLSTATLTAAIAVVAVMTLGTRTALGSGTGGGAAECFGGATGSQPTCTFKDGTAFADFGNVSEDGCIFTDAQISLYNNLTVPGRVATHNVGLIISQYDYCGSSAGVQATDFDPNIGQSTFIGTFQIASDLSTATVNGTAAMYDSISGTQVFTTTINVTFTGYGPISKYSDNQHFQAPGYVENDRFTGTSCTAEVSGTFTDPSGNNLLAVPATNGTLLNASGGTVTIIRQ